MCVGMQAFKQETGGKLSSGRGVAQYDAASRAARTECTIEGGRPSTQIQPVDIVIPRRKGRPIYGQLASRPLPRLGTPDNTRLMP